MLQGMSEVQAHTRWGFLAFLGLRLAADNIEAVSTRKGCAENKTWHSPRSCTAMRMSRSLLLSVTLTVSFALAFSNSLPSSFKKRSGSSWIMEVGVTNDIRYDVLPTVRTQGVAFADRVGWLVKLILRDGPSHLAVRFQDCAAAAFSKCIWEMGSALQEAN
jgi:hypothetical protein